MLTLVGNSKPTFPLFQLQPSSLLLPKYPLFNSLNKVNTKILLKEQPAKIKTQHTLLLKRCISKRPFSILFINKKKLFFFFHQYPKRKTNTINLIKKVMLRFIPNSLRKKEMQLESGFWFTSKRYKSIF